MRLVRGNRQAVTLIPLIVAKLTVDTRLVPPVAIHAIPHGNTNLLAHYIALGDGTVAQLASEAGGGVRAVREKYVPRNPINSHPRYRLVVLGVSGQLLDVR